MHGNIFLHKKVSVYKVYSISLDIDINEQDTSFLGCKHRHMMKSGAPPVKFSPVHLLHEEFPGFTSRIDYLRVITLGFLVFSQFLETVWVSLIT